MAVTNNTDRDSYKRGTKHIFFPKKELYFIFTCVPCIQLIRVYHKNLSTSVKDKRGDFFVKINRRYIDYTLSLLCTII